MKRNYTKILNIEDSTEQNIKKKRPRNKKGNKNNKQKDMRK